jgi:ABC-type multidrug transport system fused ATPase/permease subunit
MDCKDCQNVYKLIKAFFLLRGYCPNFPVLIVVSYCQLCFTERAICMILSCQNIDKTFDGEHILDHVSFHLEEHDRAALIGVNGAGKSTILRIIVGELAAG